MLSLRLMLCIVAGAANVFAFAPFGWWPIQIVLLAWLMHGAAQHASISRNALYGWAYGFGWIVCGVYWLYISMHQYGGMPSWMSVLAVILLALFLSTLYAVSLGAATWLQRRWNVSTTLTLLLLFPAAWSLADWTRGWFFTGFPWLAIGYAHTSSPLAGFAPMIGVYGIGWLVALAAGCLALLPTKKSTLLALLIPITLLVGGASLEKIHWTEPYGKPLSVRLLQGNVPQELKFDNEHLYMSLKLYRDMITSQPADLIVTPETAITLFLHQLPTDYIAHLRQFAQQTNSHLVLGIPMTDRGTNYANSAIGISPQMSQPQQMPHQAINFYRYDKHHLVPFGEFIPFGFRWFVKMMNIPLGDFTKASVLQPPFHVKDQAIQPNICYEDLFSEEIAAQIRTGQKQDGKGPTILLNMSNIAWFGNSTALPQHLQISQMRSLETGRPMLRATNTGMTAIIDPQGKVVSNLPAMQRGTLINSVQGFQGSTPYILLGNAIFLGITMICFILAWLSSKKSPLHK